LQEQAGDAGPPAPGSSAAEGTDQTTTTAAADTQAASTDSGDSASKGLGIAALVIAILGLIAGVAALVTRRKAAA
jgi:hypothetical protein